MRLGNIHEKQTKCHKKCENGVPARDTVCFCSETCIHEITFPFNTVFLSPREILLRIMDIVYREKFPVWSSEVE